MAAAQLRAPMFEDKVVDFLFEKATVTDKTVTKDVLEAAIEAEPEAKPDGEEESICEEGCGQGRGACEGSHACCQEGSAQERHCRAQSRKGRGSTCREKSTCQKDGCEKIAQTFSLIRKKGRRCCAPFF